LTNLYLIKYIFYSHFEANSSEQKHFCELAKLGLEKMKHFFSPDEPFIPSVTADIKQFENKYEESIEMNKKLLTNQRFLFRLGPIWKVERMIHIAASYFELADYGNSISYYLKAFRFILEEGCNQLTDVKKQEKKNIILPALSKNDYFIGNYKSCLLCSKKHKKYIGKSK
jgi:tetratricopeptide (TPR) repeat protein